MAHRARWISVLALVATASAASGCASGGYIYRSDGACGGYARNVERIAHQNGYHEGREAGEKDARRGRSFSFNRHDDWRDADDGYHRQYGDRAFYQHEFREGFRAGYADGYRYNARASRW